jgi:hypothetical protein
VAKDRNGVVSEFIEGFMKEKAEGTPSSFKVVCHNCKAMYSFMEDLFIKVRKFKALGEEEFNKYSERHNCLFLG